MDIRSIKAAARQSLRQANQNPWKLTLLFLLCSLAVSLPYNYLSMAISGSLESGLGGLSKVNLFRTADSVITLVLNVLVTLWGYHYQNYALQLSRGEETSFRDFTAPFRIFIPVFCLYFLSSLFIGLWSMLFVIPGIVAAYRYRLAFFSLFDDETRTASDALNESKRLTYGHKVELLKLDLSFLWYYLLLSVPEVISIWAMYGLLVIPDRMLIPLNLGMVLFTAVVQVLFLPYISAAQAHAYNWILRMDRGPVYSDRPDPNAPIQLPPSSDSFAP